MIQRNEWRLLFHTGLFEQLRAWRAAVERARTKDPKVAECGANARLFDVLSKLTFATVPNDPNCEAYRQGQTMGAAFRHWRRVKIGRRFRLLLRFD